MSTYDRRRQACRLGGFYIVDQGRVLTEVLDQNFVTVLVFLAMLRANVDGITASPDIALRHLGITQTPPDDYRMPVSVYALARNLSLPYETARRHVLKLKDAGLCIAVAGGLIVPTSLLMGPEARDAALATQRAVQVFVDEADRFGIVGLPESVSTSADAPLQVARLTTDYLVDGVVMMSRTLEVDTVGALAMQAVGLMNTASLRRDPALGSEFGGLADIPPDHLRRPVSVYSVAKFLRLPYETTRRTLHWLVELGLVHRDDNGAMIVPTEVYARPEIVAGYDRFAQLTQTFLDRLAEYGVKGRRPDDRRVPGVSALRPVAMAGASAGGALS